MDLLPSPPCSAADSPLFDNVQKFVFFYWWLPLLLQHIKWMKTVPLLRWVPPLVVLYSFHNMNIKMFQMLPLRIYWSPSMDKNFQKSPVNICFICILAFAPYLYMDFHLWSWSSIFINVIFALYTFRSYERKFQKSMIIMCFAVCILVL